MTLTGLSRSNSIRDQRILRLVELASPRALIEELPLSDEHAEVLLRGRAEVEAILQGHDDRLLVVVGPCSVHDVVATQEYAERLAAEVKGRREDLCLAMRVYFEKPRTSLGWKGLINDPHLDGSSDVNTGLRMARRLLLEVLSLGLPVGCEFLDPITPQYISDAVCWGAIGARTVESQIHRQLGSGLSMPVGFKNRTDGNVQVAVDAVRAAGVSHAFAGIDENGTPAILYTRGNEDSHVILRGGKGAPNYDAESVALAIGLLRAASLPERVMIDLSHDNSGKDPERQPAVADAVAEQISAGQPAICGVMLESFLVAGRQDLESRSPTHPLVYGQSITDGCIGWETTVEVLDTLAAAVRARRDAG
jgi:3-deoxy-7-phosphoheptulonate synthase